MLMQMMPYIQQALSFSCGFKYTMCGTTGSPQPKDAFYNKPDTYLCRPLCLMNACLQSQPMVKPANTQSHYISHQTWNDVISSKEGG